jgi:hydroxymethylbilane synthase
MIIGSRGSALALAQTRLVQNQLQQIWPKISIELKIIKTTGDKLSEKKGALPDGKGIFTKELEDALRGKEIDLAIHSLKDLPTENPDGLVVGAIPARADARDVLITREEKSLIELKKNAKIATGSNRRLAQLQLKRPDIEGVPIRGNIDTRLRKFRENSKWAGLILAQAGLDRLQPDLSGLQVTPLNFDEMLPAPGQGALALQIRAGDHEILKTIMSLHHISTQEQIIAERAFLAALGGGCQAPVGAYAEIKIDMLVLHGIYWHGNEKAPRRGFAQGLQCEAQQIGRKLAEDLLKQ